jgi:hypothetical protein
VLWGEDGDDHFSAADGLADTLDGGYGGQDVLDSYDNGIDSITDIP